MKFKRTPDTGAVPRGVRDVRERGDGLWRLEEVQNRKGGDEGPDRVGMVTQEKIKVYGSRRNSFLSKGLFGDEVQYMCWEDRIWERKGDLCNSML